MATAADFKLLNANDHYVAALNLTLQYGATNPAVASEIQSMIDAHAIVMFNPPGNPLVDPKDAGQTLFGHMPDGTPVILWNPDQAAVVWTTDPQGNRTITGIQSSAQGFFHELTHGIDPAQQDHAHEPDAQYDNMSERTAVTIESVIATEMGEPIRNNHAGSDAPVSNPTLHTITTEDGALQLTWMDSAGQQYYGPQVSIGSPEWNNLQQFGQQQAAQNPPIDNDPQPVAIDGDIPGYTPPDTTGGYSGDPSGYGPGTDTSGGGDTGGGWVADPDGGYTDMPDVPWNPLDPAGGGIVYTFKTGTGTSGAATSSVTTHTSEPAHATAVSQVTHVDYANHLGMAALQQWLANGGNYESPEQLALQQATKLVISGDPNVSDLPTSPVDASAAHPAPVIDHAPADHSHVEIVGAVHHEHVLEHALA